MTASTPFFRVRWTLRARSDWTLHSFQHAILYGLLCEAAADPGAGLSPHLPEGLLLDALQRSLDLSDNLGTFAVEVDALDHSAVAFYVKYGFAPLLDNPRHLYLPMATIEKVLG